MRTALFSSAAVTIACLVSGCGGSKTGGDAHVTLSGQTYAVSDVNLTYELGDDGYFRIDGDDAAHPEQDCLPGLTGGLALYGDLPSTITSLPDLFGKEFPFEFTGDGDDANLCFVGSNGLLGVETGTVRFGKVDATKVEFSFSGNFTLYDGEGGQASSKVVATGDGVARIAAN